MAVRVYIDQALRSRDDGNDRSGGKVQETKRSATVKVNVTVRVVVASGQTCIFLIAESLMLTVASS